MAGFHALQWHHATTADATLEPSQPIEQLSWHAPAELVMESFHDHVTLFPESTRLPEAEQRFERNDTRYAGVLNANQKLSGMLLARELHSRQSGALSTALQVPWSQVEVKHLMEPIERLPVLDRGQLRQAKIGDIAATMQAAGKNFVVIEANGAIVGFISSLRILAATGESVRLYPKATTFVEVFTALKHPEITDS